MAQNFRSVVRVAACIRCGTPRREDNFSYNESRCKPCNSARVNARTKELRRQAIAVLGGRSPCCAKCRSTEALEVDHVQGGGSNHRRRVSRQRYYQEIIAGAAQGDYRLLCESCNGSGTKLATAIWIEAVA